MSNSSRYIPKVGDKVEVVRGPDNTKVWVGYIGKVISVQYHADGRYHGARVHNPMFKEKGHSLDSWWFPEGRLRKV